MNVQDIKSATTSELLAFYNSKMPENKIIKKFRDRATAEKRVQDIIESPQIAESEHISAALKEIFEESSNQNQEPAKEELSELTEDPPAEEEKKEEEEEEEENLSGWVPSNFGARDINFTNANQTETNVGRNFKIKLLKNNHRFINGSLREQVYGYLFDGMTLSQFIATIKNAKIKKERGLAALQKIFDAKLAERKYD